ncbi:hypothetical protein [Actinomadura parmotrematis]|uniref:Uncharacterized protein n=1 Tax=Actinomadura parmotrematis TaxID=2864039 RepID=A0ABS7FWP3_9ACTN|nr:hypothetical protein [Actinomadura parmotrematis]MBW8484850.1 hypothetical protein [Actinomadura parmotrematis]
MPQSGTVGHLDRPPQNPGGGGAPVGVSEVGERGRVVAQARQNTLGNPPRLHKPPSTSMNPRHHSHQPVSIMAGEGGAGGVRDPQCLIDLAQVGERGRQMRGCGRRVLGRRP